VGDDAKRDVLLLEGRHPQHFASLKDYPGLTGTLTCGGTGHDAGDCGSQEVSIAQLERRLHRGLHDPPVGTIDQLIGRTPERVGR
jgi:hypothetical protein